MHLAADIYKPDEWHDFFLMVGGGSAALTGLVFVARSLNLAIIFRDATHRSRAVGTLSSFVAVFIICGLTLMGGQTHMAVDIDWLVVGLNILRLAGGTGCYIAQVVGSALLIAGYVAGLYVAAVAMVVFFAFMISGAWLLLVGVHQDEQRLPAAPAES